jgi:hypothetical protein
MFAALLPLVLSLAPQLANLIFGAKGGEATAKVADVVSAVTGADLSTADGAALAVAAINGKPGVAAALQQKLIELHTQMQIEADREADQQRKDVLENMKAAFADTVSARTMATSGPGLVKYGAMMVSAIVLALFAAYVLVQIFSNHTDKEIDPAVKQLMYTAVTLVLGFWLGSSSGSVSKSETISNLTAVAQQSVPSHVALQMLNAPSPPPVPPPSPPGTTADDLNAQSLQNAEATNPPH